jgi:hypothetical protein
MREFRTCARSLVGSALVLVACVISLGVPCVAQEAEPPDPPTLPPVGAGRGSLFAPSAWLVLITPVQERIDLKIYGFYIGELGVPVAQLDLPIRTAKWLYVTPSYMYYRVPASGLNKLTPQPGHFTNSYVENQFRIDVTVVFPIHKFEVSVRNMYVRRFRPDPLDDINRYRGRIAIAHPVAVHGSTWKPFASYEAAYEQRNGGWNRNRLWAGVTVPLKRHILIQPSYMWERSDGSRDINYLLLGLIVSTR